MSQGTNSGKVGAAMFALASTLTAALAGTFLAIQSFFPWMTVLNAHDSTEPDTTEGTSSVVDVTTGGPTPAQRTLKKVMGIRVPQLRGDGWDEITASTGVPGVSFGFGCDPTDGLAPVVAESRSWVQTQTARDTSLVRATASLEVSARAYPAGGGAVAFTGLTEAVVRCEAASSYTSSGVGVEVVQVVTAKSTSLVWRRGDVIMVGTVTSRGGRGSIPANMSVFQRFDKTLKAALRQSCLNPASESADAKRSPYVNRKEFFGNSQVMNVKRDPKPKRFTAEARAKVPVVAIPGPHVKVPYVSYLPTAPSPAVTSGPTGLPVPVPVPTEPDAPTVKAKNVTDVPRKIDDPDGPGCGWDFTGQVRPNFNATAAESDYDKAVVAAKKAMALSWKRWQTAKLSYYGDYATYVASTKSYKEYATKVEEVRQAWAIVDAARSTYYTALANYNAAVTALAQWTVDRDEARADYKNAKKACRNRPEPEPTPEPTPEPSPTPGKPSPTPTPEPKPEEPKMVCPPPRPDILDQSPPTVPPKPMPSPTAQLPSPPKN